MPFTPAVPYSQTPDVTLPRTPQQSLVGTVPALNNNWASGSIAVVGDYGVGLLRCVRLRLQNAVFNTTDATTNGAYAGAAIYALPRGAAWVPFAALSFDLTTGAGLTATATVKVSLGTAVEASNDTLDSTQANILPSSNIATTANAASNGQGRTATIVTTAFDGTASAIQVFLNFGVADAGSTASTTITVTDGFVEIYYIPLSQGNIVSN